MPNKPYIVIRSEDGHRLAWLSDEAPPKNVDEGQIGEHLDTGARFIYYRGDWHRQRSRRKPVKGSQFGLSVSSSVVRLTVPDAAECAEITVRSNTVVFTRDGTDPTATKGMPANTGDIIMLNSRAELIGFEVIRESADATLDVTYFTALAS